MNQEKTLWQVVKGYFNALPDKENEEETIQQINSGITFHGSNLWILVFAIFTASLGLNVNSTAVIIGAMLISPLMGPIIGMGLSIGIGDWELLKRSITNYGVATLISVVTATLYFLITPLTDAQSELLARTSPTLYDVLIALCGGAAGILALSTKGKGNVIPGVAIATALMPPLCTAGYGLAVGNLSFFFGAFLLFFINTVFIALATYAGVRMLRFKHKSFVDPERMRKVNRYIAAIALITMVPAAYMTVQIIKKSVMENNTFKFVKHELNYPGTQVISQNRDDATKTLNVVAVGKMIPSGDIKRIGRLMTEYNLGDYKLNLIQGSQSDSLLLLNHELNIATTNTEANKQRLVEQAGHIRTLESQLSEYTRYDALNTDICKEINALWPYVASVSLTKASEARTDTSRTYQYVMAVITSKDRTKINPKEQSKLRLWLKERVNADSLRLIIAQ
jgi:uncharacterized hydrophobic protein (TIGR00271 family)